MLRLFAAKTSTGAKAGELAADERYPCKAQRPGCPLHATQPKSNAKFWRDKISSNRTRDRLVTHLIRADFLDQLFAFQIKLR